MEKKCFIYLFIFSTCNVRVLPWKRQVLKTNRWPKQRPRSSGIRIHQRKQRGQPRRWRGWGQISVSRYRHRLLSSDCLEVFVVTWLHRQKHIRDMNEDCYIIRWSYKQLRIYTLRRLDCQPMTHLIYLQILYIIFLSINKNFIGNWKFQIFQRSNRNFPHYLNTKLSYLRR